MPIENAATETMDGELALLVGLRDDGRLTEEEFEWRSVVAVCRYAALWGPRPKDDAPAAPPAGQPPSRFVEPLSALGLVVVSPSAVQL